jgi:hypothetical protein
MYSKGQNVLHAIENKIRSLKYMTTSKKPKQEKLYVVIYNDDSADVFDEKDLQLNASNIFKDIKSLHELGDKMKFEMKISKCE